MATDLSEMNELYGRGLDGKQWVMNGCLVKKEIKQEEEEHMKNTGDGIEKKGEMTNGGSGKGIDATSVFDHHPSLPSSVDVIVHTQNDRPQLSVKVEEGHATVNRDDSLVDGLQQLKDALKSKELLNSMLMAKLEQVREERNEEQRKNAQLTEELKLAKEKLNSITGMDKERETEVAVGKVTSTTTTTIQPSGAAIAAQLLGIGPQLLDEPQPNEWREKFDQLNIKYSKMKRLYRTEQKVAAEWRKKQKDKKSGGTPIEGNEEPSLAHLGVTDQVEAGESNREAVSSPIQNEHHLGQQTDANDAERRMQQGGTVVARRFGVYKCPECPAERVAFSSAQLLAQHQQRFHDVRQHYRHQCPDCGLACLTSDHLKMHRRTHTGEKPHKCRQCDKEFAQKGNLTRHERLHTGEQPYVCAVCQKAFIDSSHLTMHARVHSGERPFSCQHCAKQFKISSHCRRHEMICPKRPSATSA